MQDTSQPATKAAKKLSKADADAIVDEVRTRIDDSWKHDRYNRHDAASDLSFLAGEQWPDAVRREREAAGRPMLTLNRLPQFVRQVTNDIRQADFAIKAIPEDDQQDPKLAKIYDGLIRQIQYRSSATHVFSIAAEHQASCGIGWFRIVTEYSDDDAFDLEIKFKSIRNPLSVYDDPAAIEHDRSDAMWRIVSEVIPRTAFKAAYPKAQEVSIERPLDTKETTLFWSTSDTVRIAEYWRKVKVKKTLAQLQDGRVIDITGRGEGELGYFPIAKTREVDAYDVESYMVSGAEVLSGPHKWPGKYIPIVPVIGGEFPLENRTYRYGVIRFARDAQQLYNYYRTATAEAIALAPKAPYLVTPNMVAPFKGLWDTAGKTNRPYLPYQPDKDAPGAKPFREAPPPLPTALIQEAQIASDDMKATTGIYDAGLGKQSNETSGVAIGRRQHESDVANYHFADNLQRSLEYAGRVLIDLIPKVYDNERVIRLMPDEGANNNEHEPVTINQVVMGVGGVPVMVNDLSAGKFDIRVKVGKSYSTKRAEAADSMLQFVQAVPQAGAVSADLIAKNFDWPGADELAKRLRNTIPPNILADPDKPETQPPPDPVKQQMDQINVAMAAGKAAELHAKTENLRADTMVKLAQAMVPPQGLAEQFPVQFGDEMPPQIPPQGPPPGPMPGPPMNVPPGGGQGPIDPQQLAEFQAQQHPGQIPPSP